MTDFAAMGEHHCLRDVPKGGIIFDVGCNRGAWSHMAIERCAPSVIHCFEPQPGITEIRPPMIVNNFAMGSICSMKSLHQYADKSKSTFYRKSDAVEEKYSRFGVKHIGVVSVAVETIDSFCYGHCIDQIDYLKIDAEGHDLFVMMGAFTMLEEHLISRLQFEYGGCWKDAGLRLQEAFSILNQRGYAIRKISPLELSRPLEWGDSMETYEYSNFYAERM